jgi:hypothetical protein
VVCYKVTFITLHSKQEFVCPGFLTPLLKLNLFNIKKLIMNSRQKIRITGFLVVLFSVNIFVNAAEYYVSLNGNDQNPGTKNKPFRTIPRAQAAVREKIAEGLNKPLTVFLREGFYEISEPLIFGPQDSGTPSAPVTYASAPGETAVLSGGKRISGWKVCNNKVWTVNLPEVKNNNWFFRHLTVNGKRATRARWPNNNENLRIKSVENGVKKFKFNKRLPEITTQESDTELVIIENWAVTRALIVNADTQQVTTATAMGWIGHKGTTASRGKAAFIEHNYNFINEPGEWFLNRTTGDLTYFPQKSQKPNNTIVTAPELEQIISITGTGNQPVKHLYFKRLNFKHTHFPLPSFGYNEIQAAHYGIVYTKDDFYVQPAAVECVYAKNCCFDNCTFAHFGASGIALGPGCSKNSISNCRIKDIGGNGIMVGWRGTGKLNPNRKILCADWADANMTPSSNKVSNCRICCCGAESYGGVGIFAAFSADTLISHNHVYNMPYTGISIGYVWSTEKSSQVRCIVENNHIHNVMKFLADGGGIYTLGYQPGTILRGNHIHDIKRSQFAYGAQNNGFFIDEGSKGYLFEQNVVYDTSGDAVRFHRSKPEWHQWNSNFFSDKKPTENKEVQEIIDNAGPNISGL